MSSSAALSCEPSRVSASETGEICDDGVAGGGTEGLKRRRSARWSARSRWQLCWLC